MEENSFWRCPNCETINSAKTCVLCGEKRPSLTSHFDDTTLEDVFNSGKQAGYAEAKEELSKQYSKKKNVLIVAVLFLTMIAIFFAIIAVYKKSTTTLSKNNITMNSNAQIVYMSALNYCLECSSQGNSIEDGVFLDSFAKADIGVVFDGSREDMKNYLNHTIGQEMELYYCIVLKNGTPSTVAWGMEPFDVDNKIITQEKIIEENQTIGLYPPFGEIDIK